VWCVFRFVLLTDRAVLNISFHLLLHIGPIKYELYLFNVVLSP
jgi:hypothetical protein